MSFILDWEEYAFDILKVQETNRMADITTIPTHPLKWKAILTFEAR